MATLLEDQSIANPAQSRRPSLIHASGQTGDTRMKLAGAALVAIALVAPSLAQGQPSVDWSRVQAETLQHYQALVRLDTTDPPGNESLAANYLRQVLEKEGIPVQLFEAEPNRANLVARLKGSGRKRPLLVVGHTDTVRVDPQKWTFPPFSAAREGGYIYGRGTIDDKDNVAAALMTMLLLKRGNVALDRDVIFLAEAGEEPPRRSASSSWFANTSRTSTPSSASRKVAASCDPAAAWSSPRCRHRRRGHTPSSWWPGELQGMAPSPDWTTRLCTWRRLWRPSASGSRRSG